MALVMLSLILISQIADLMVSQCPDGFYYHGNTCEECFLLCKNCGSVCFQCVYQNCPDEMCAYNNCTGSSCSNIYCTTCPDGYYLDALRSRRCFRCSTPYCKCSNDNDCTGCIPGKYNPSSFCQDNCPSNCATCLSSTDCTECSIGKYGKLCQSDCITTCGDGSCDRYSGFCQRPQDCPDGQYLDSMAVCQNCPARCSTCTDMTNCTSCKNTSIYKWGATCQHDCAGCSKPKCSKDDGCSSGCDSSHYQTYNNIKHGFECIPCPNGCLTCISAPLCLSCALGFWGSICEYECSGCAGQCDMTDGACSVGCILGYYPQLNDGKHYCIKCPEDCEICTDLDNCATCKAGFYPENAMGCVKCSKNCKGGICDPNNGICTENCESHWLGNYCNVSCPSACLECELANTLTCTACISGSYGVACENNCSINCKNETCNRINGSCEYGCIDRYWGSLCNTLCEEGCKKGLCDDVTGSCINGCKSTHYGEHCKNRCHENCKTESSSLRNCNATTGACQWGCNDGYFGSNCTEECRNCKNNVCYQYNGTCKDSCSTESTGQNCTRIVEAGPQTSEIQSPSTNSLVTGLSVGLGIISLVAVIAIAGNILQYVRRRRNLTKAPSNIREINPPAETVGANDYQDLKNNPSEDRTYSVVINDYENTT